MRLNVRGSARQRAELARAAGCRLEFVGAPGLSASYALDPVEIDTLRMMVRDGQDGLLTGTIFHHTKDGETRELTVDQASRLYRALRDYTTALDRYATGWAAALPPQPVIIEA